MYLKSLVQVRLTQKIDLFEPPRAPTGERRSGGTALAGGSVLTLLPTGGAEGLRCRCF